MNIVYNTQRLLLGNPLGLHRSVGTSRRDATMQNRNGATLDCRGLRPRNDAEDGFVIASHEVAKQSRNTAYDIASLLLLRQPHKAKFGTVYYNQI
jgi:hypothetical protein